MRVSRLKNARDLMEDIRSGAVHYDFVEMMARNPGGCVGGGGQPYPLDSVEMADVRGPKLYKLDSQEPLRFSLDNPEIIRLYREYLEKYSGRKSPITCCFIPTDKLHLTDYGNLENILFRLLGQRRKVHSIIEGFVEGKDNTLVPRSVVFLCEKLEIRKDCE